MNDVATPDYVSADPATGKVGGASYTLNDCSMKPSEQLIAAADSRVTVQDGRGRQILLRKPKVLEQFRLVEALGDTAANQVYMGMVMPLLFIGSIDGIAVATPSRKSEVEALINRLDDDGISAVMEGVVANFGAGSEADEKNG